MQAKAINRKLIASFSVVGLIASLIIGLTLGSSGATADRSSVGDSQEFSTGAPDPATSQFSILKPADSFGTGEIPTNVLSVLAEMPATEDGQGSGVVNALGVAPSGSVSSQVVLAEVSDRLCIFATGNEYHGAAVGNCFALSDAAAGKGYVAVQGLVDDSVRVIGVAPDGVASVSIDAGEDGTVDEQVVVSGNIYQADLDKAPTSVTGMTSSGSKRFQVEMPLSGSSR